VTSKTKTWLWEPTKRLSRNLHWAMTALLVLAFVPALRLAGLPLRLDWETFLTVYWISLALRSICVAILFYVLGFPVRETLVPLWERYRRQKLRLLVVAAFAALMFWELGWLGGLLLSVDTVAFLEFFDRIAGAPATLGRTGRDVFIPAVYLFAGLVLVFCYNDVIAALKFAGSYDAAFNRVDSILLYGLNVSLLAHDAARWFPFWGFALLQSVYFGMFGQIGAALLFTALYFGRQRSLQFVGVVLTSFYIALAIFLFWPSMGPFAICPDHFSRLPGPLGIYATQKTFLLKAQLLAAHRLAPLISTDYYIGFPCMHVVQPLIVLWFLRPWKGIVVALALYDLVLVASILLLEQHYVVDLIGGAVVAAFAITMVDHNDIEKALGRGNRTSKAP